MPISACGSRPRSRLKAEKPAAFFTNSYPLSQALASPRCPNPRQGMCFLISKAILSQARAGLSTSSGTPIGVPMGTSPTPAIGYFRGRMRKRCLNASWILSRQGLSNIRTFTSITLPPMSLPHLSGSWDAMRRAKRHWTGSSVPRSLSIFTVWSVMLSARAWRVIPLRGLSRFTASCAASASRTRISRWRRWKPASNLKISIPSRAGTGIPLKRITGTTAFPL